MDSQLSNQQQQYLDETLKRAGAFEELVRTKGWEYVKSFYQNRVQALANGLLLSDEPITKFEAERQELMGIRKLLSYIDSDLTILADFRKKNEAKSE